MWGGFGIYFKALSDVSPLEILGHRVIWSAVFLAILVTLWGKWTNLLSAVSHPRQFLSFCLSASLITINWGFYIYAIVSGQALEGSMGYFIMPLVAVGLGTVFLSERFNKVQVIAIIMALSGVIYQIVSYGKFPLIALALAFSFGLYGMLRKQSTADSVTGLFIETLIITPFALGALFYWGYQGDLAFLTGGLNLQLLLILAGPVTAAPLILFAFGAQRMRYSTVGLLQYINPTCQFCLAIFIFNEAFTETDLITFACIWVGLIIYSTNVYLQTRRVRPS